MQAKELIAFEEEIATAFNNKEIRAPIHLHGNNENQLIKYLNQLVKLIGFLVLGEAIIIAYLKGSSRSIKKGYSWWQKYDAFISWI